MLSSPTSDRLLQEMSKLIVLLNDPSTSFIYSWFLKREFQNLCDVAKLYVFNSYQQRVFNDLVSSFLGEDIEKPLLADS